MSFKLVGIGEVLWDLLPGGRQLGGAPANFAYHACSLGAEGRVISRIGSDDLGRELLERLAGLGLPTDGLQLDPCLPTGTVTVEVDLAGEPRFTIHEGVAWDNLQRHAVAQNAASGSDAICFGTLAQRCEPSRSTLQELVRTAPPHALKILDVNLRQHYFSPELIEQSLLIANVVKVNETELPRLSALLGLNGDAVSQLEQLSRRYGLRAAALTRGGHGSLLWAGGQWSDHPGVPAQVCDTVGAGDSFTAAMALGLLLRREAKEVNHAANQVAAYVASCPGATPKLPDRLKALFCEPNIAP